MRLIFSIAAAVVLLALDGCFQDTSDSRERALIAAAKLGNQHSRNAVEDAGASFPAVDVAASHQEALARLQKAYDRFPRSAYLYCNTERAAALTELLASASGPDRYRLAFMRASELLYAGQTEIAVEELLQIIRAVRSKGPGLTWNTKPVYDMVAIAYLRLGEEQNCCANHNEESCFFPIMGKAVHTKRQGSESAIKVYKHILKRFPDDIQSKYLLNLAYMTLGEYPDQVPDELLIPDLGRPSEIDFPRFRDIAAKTGTDIVGLSGGVCLEDMNSDGRLDILRSSYGLDDQIHYLENCGNHFEDRTTEAGLQGVVSGLNMIHADYDNDGDNDVFLLRGAWLGEQGCHPNSLLRNNGDGTFHDVTILAEVYSEHPTQNACWADFDNDGWLDLFIGNEHTSQGEQEHACELYMNRGDGTFAEVADQAGVSSMVFAKGCAAADYDNDGRQDLYVSCLGGKNLLYRNLGVGADGVPRFEEVAATAGVQEPILSFPCWFFDYDNDGFQDLFVADFDPIGFTDLAGIVAQEMTGHTTDAEKPRLYHNLGDGTFEDVTRKAGLWRSMFGMGSNYGDLNNDGYLDFYVGTGAPDYRMIVPNLMFLNDRGQRFVDVTTSGRFGNLQKGHAVAFGDVDNDGDQDIYAVIGGALEGDRYHSLLFENPGWNNQWLMLELEGRDSNRSAIGAMVEVKFVDANEQQRSLYRRVGTGGSFGSSSLWQEIGLGSCSEIQSVKVNWPNGRSEWESFEGIQRNQAYHLLEGSGNAQPMRRPRTQYQP